MASIGGEKFLQRRFARVFSALAALVILFAAAMQLAEAQQTWTQLATGSLQPPSVRELTSGVYSARTNQMFVFGGVGGADLSASVIYYGSQGSNNVIGFDQNTLAAKVFSEANPVGLAVDAGENLYVALFSAGTVQKFSPAGASLGTFATLSGAQGPFGLAFDAAGNLYVSALTTGVIQKFDTAGRFLGNVASISNARGLGFDSSGNLYAVSSATGAGAGAVFKLNTGVNSNPNPTPFVVSGLADPRYIVFDSAGNFYVSNTGSGGTTGYIERYTSSGTDLGVFIRGLGGPNQMTFVGTELWVSEFFNNDIIRISPQGTLAGVFRTGVSGANGLVSAPSPAASAVWALSNANGSGTSTWSSLTTALTSPLAPARSGHSAIYNSTADGMLIFGGVSKQSNLLNDVWVLNNVTGGPGIPQWQQITPAGTPPPARSNHAAVYDQANDRMIVFGGSGPTIPGTVLNIVAFKDVWVLSGAFHNNPVWTPLSPAGGPPAGSYGTAYGYDPASNRLIVIGGVGDNFGNLAASDVWVLSNANGLGAGTPQWSRLGAVGTAPAPRSGAMSAYGSSAKVLVLFGGNTSGGFVSDIWTLTNADGASGAPAWVAGPAISGPSARGLGASVLDPGSNTMTIFGGISSAGATLNDTWALHNSLGQFQLTTLVSPPGSGTVSPGSGLVAAGAQVSLSATPGAGFQFSNWSGDISGTANPTSIVMNGPHSVTAVFTSSCTYTLASPSATVPSTASTQSLGITATCPFSVVSNNPDWIMITSSGANSIGYSVSANNTGASRTGSFTVLNASNFAVATFNITQQSAPCTALTVSPTSASFQLNGGTGTAMFNTSPCGWSATSSDPSWVTLGAASGTGPSFTFNVSPVGVGTPATGPTRSATITINGTLKIAVTQQATQICTYTLATSAQDNSTTKTFPATGGIRGSGVNVTTQGDIPGQPCVWKPQLNGSLLNLTNPGPGGGSGTMGYTVSDNTSGSAQTQTINIAGQLYVIKVAGVSQTYSAVVTTGVPPVIRSQGKSELTSDVIVNLSGTAVTGGVTGDVIVTMSNTSITNHVLSTDPTGQTTDALLLVGEPAPAALALNGNAFRGVIAGPNAIRFRNVPLVPSGNSAFNRTLRITNLRVDASLPGLTSVQAIVSMVAAAPFLIANAPQVAQVQSGVGFTGPTWPGSTVGQSTVPIQFNEGFATAFRPRLAAGQDPSQPGAIYNSESGFVNSTVLGIETGFANTGTRLVARFSNIPLGVTLYAPVGPASGTNAQLMSADNNGAGGSPVPGNTIIGGAPYQSLAVVAGVATATWEITSSNSSAIDTLKFNLVVNNPTGANLSVIQTNGSLGPQSGVSAPSSKAPVPRFVPPVAPPPISLSIAPLITSTGGATGVSQVRRGRNSVSVYRAASGGVVLGGTVTITEILANNDTQPATNVVVGGSLPATALFVECAASDGGGSCALSGNSMRVTYPSIGAGQIATIRLRAAFPNAGDLAEFNANVTSDSPLSNLTNGSYTANFTTVPAAVLNIASSHTPAAFQTGGIGTYTLLVTNNGAAASAPDDPIIVTNTLPSGFTLQSMTGGVGWSCTGTTCQLSGSLLVNSTASPITVTVKVTGPVLSPALNVANVSGGGSAPASVTDPTPIGSTTITGVTSGPLAFYPVTPCRVLDTRSYGGKTGAFGPPFLTGGKSRDFPIPAGSCNIPSTAGAYSLNVTVFPHKPLGYLSVWPAGLSFPVVSTLNSFDGAVVANAAIVPAGTNGSITVLASDDTDVFMDINGYFADPAPGGLTFYPVTPCRVADTRSDQGKTGPFGPPSMTPNSTRTFPMPSSGCNIPATAQAYSLNMTAWPPGILQWLTTWPAGQAQPVASTLNDYQGGIVANAAIVPAGAGGGISIFVTELTNVFFDINGYFAAPGPGGLYFYTMTPCRIADTRSYGGKTGAFGPPSLAGGKSRDFSVSMACSVPASAQAYSLNMTVWPPAAMQFLTTWPAGQPQPVVSTLNAVTGRVTANAAIVPAGANGSISVFVSDPTDLFFDINGIFAP